jgi:nucleoid-associated protein YgaU
MSAPHYTRLRNGHCRYTIQCIEYAPPENFVFVRAPELTGPDRMDFWLQQAIARAKAFNLQGAIAKLYNKLSDIEEYISRVHRAVKDIQNLAELPAGMIARLRADLSLVQLYAFGAQTSALAILNPGSTSTSTSTSSLQDAAAAIYQYLQLLHTEAALMSSRAGALPTKDQTYLVCGQDTLQSISIHFYGSINRWQDIAVVNKLWDPTLLAPGDILVIPA